MAGSRARPNRKLTTIVHHGGHLPVRAWTRGGCKEHLIDEAPRSRVDELAAWTVEADRGLVF